MTARAITKLAYTLFRSVRHSSTSGPTSHIRKDMITSTMFVTFLGTSSGGGPSASRNCSSLVADLLGDGTLWMVDCAEGTLRQFQLQPYSQDRSNVRLSQVKKIFITHMHADHVMGIIPILRNVLFPVPVGEDAAQLEALRKHYPSVQIYGPAGIRTFVRSILKMTLTKMADNYVVHELLTPTDIVTPCDQEIMHVNEVAGEDILCSQDGFWRDVTQQKGTFGPVTVDAGPIAHRDPCIGYVFRESTKPFRKIVILGDTHDPSAIIPLCIEPSPSLLVHEATDAHISLDIDPKAKRPYDIVKQKALKRGHSIPPMAGTFAKTIGAQKLVLNHIGGRFPALNPNEGFRVTGIRANVIAEIERQATEAWGMGTARVAWDYMRVAIPSEPPQMTAQDQPGTSTQGPTLSDYPTARNTWMKHETPSGSHGHEGIRDHQSGWRSQNVGSGSRHRHHPGDSGNGNVDPSRNDNGGSWKRRR